MESQQYISFLWAVHGHAADDRADARRRAEFLCVVWKHVGTVSKGGIAICGMSGLEGRKCFQGLYEAAPPSNAGARYRAAKRQARVAINRERRRGRARQLAHDDIRAREARLMAWAVPARDLGDPQGLERAAREEGLDFIPSDPLTRRALVIVRKIILDCFRPPWQGQFLRSNPERSGYQRPPEEQTTSRFACVWGCGTVFDTQVVADWRAAKRRHETATCPARYQLSYQEYRDHRLKALSDKKRNRDAVTGRGIHRS